MRADSNSLETLPPLRQVINALDLRAKKALGQNFLLDQNITDRIARVAGDVAGRTIVEIGPGPGGLTRSLLRTNAKKVIAIEFDPRAGDAIRQIMAVSDGRLELMEADALKIDWATFFQAHRGAIIVANLPYNISTTLLVDWLKVIAADETAVSSMVLMFQKEVGERLVADPHSRDYGRLSVLTQWITTVDRAFTLPPAAFLPPPKVHSSVLRFVPKGRTPEDPSWRALDHLLIQAFAQRRKMLRGNLKNYLPQLAEIGIDPTVRAEDVSVQDYLALARKIERM